MFPRRKKQKIQDPEQATEKTTHVFFVASLFFVFCGLLFAGCGPKYTYPAEKVPESVEKICREEYKLNNVQAAVSGRTIGAVFYIDSILDDKGQIPKEVHEQMGKVIQAVTRVALSTDLPLDFCSVFVRDKKQGHELIITRSIEDSKRANADAIGVEESINRTLFDQGRYQPEEGEKKPFVLKEVKLETFLAEQIVQRIRFGFSKDSKDAKSPSEEEIASQPFVLVDGVYDSAPAKKGFRFSILSMKAEDPKQTIVAVFRTVNAVLEGYKFTDFNQIEILDYLNRQKLLIDRATLLSFQKKQIKEKEILDRYLTESQSIQEAFKLFGFNVPPDVKDPKDAAAIPTPAP